MLHKGKTFRTKDRRCYALIRSTPSGNQEVCVVINGKLNAPKPTHTATWYGHKAPAYHTTLRY